MTPDERQMIADLFERIRANAAAPRDAQAEAFINDAIRALPAAPYVLTQTVLVQQHTLEEAARRIADLEAQVKQAAAPPPQETSFLGGLFGSRAAPAPAPQQQRSSYDSSAYRGASAPQQPSYASPAYAPPPQPGPWGAPAAPAGGGFLQGALQAAAGVAGGLLIGNALEGMLGGRGGGLFGGGMANAAFAPRETINNYYETAPDPAGQHAQDVLQDMDQDQDDAQDAGDFGGDDGSSDT